METERKFIVYASKLPALKNGVRIVQGYLAAEHGKNGREVRLRAKGNRYYMATKEGNGLQRPEREREIDYGLFHYFWPCTNRRRIEKTRYVITLEPQYIPSEDRDFVEKIEFKAEIDVYEGKLEGLIVVEVEFDSKREAHYFSMPEWFGREVTYDPHYRNKNLALHGLPPDFVKEVSTKN